MAFSSSIKPTNINNVPLTSKNVVRVFLFPKVCANKFKAELEIFIKNKGSIVNGETKKTVIIASITKMKYCNAFISSGHLTLRNIHTIKAINIEYIAVKTKLIINSQVMFFNNPKIIPTIINKRSNTYNASLFILGSISGIPSVSPLNTLCFCSFFLPLLKKSFNRSATAFNNSTFKTATKIDVKKNPVISNHNAISICRNTNRNKGINKGGYWMDYTKFNNPAANCNPKPNTIIPKPQMAVFGFLILSFVDPPHQKFKLLLYAWKANMTAPRKLKPNPIISNIFCMSRLYHK